MLRLVPRRSIACAALILGAGAAIWASKEATTHGGPFAAEVAGFRTQIGGMVKAVFNRDPDSDVPWPATTDAFARAFVGAGESLANWWLEHPDKPKERIARLLLNLAR